MKTSTKTSAKTSIEATALAWTEEDLAYLSARGITREDAERQIRALHSPPRALRLLRPATVGDGIERLSPDRCDELEAAGAAAGGRVTRFVPASGAASRMFKSLVALAEGAASEGDRLDGEHLLGTWRDLPFATEIARIVGSDDPDVETLVDAIVGGPPGLGLPDLPKGLVPFHRTAAGARTPFEEHLLEAADHARDPDTGACRLHFTVPVEHQERIRDFLESRRAELQHHSGAQFELSYSVQKPSTDTVSLNEDGSLVRAQDGEPLLRPGGHGALLANLDDLGADLVVLKNIDNILPAERREVALRWKRILLGRLLELDAWITALLENLETLDVVALQDSLARVEHELGCSEAASRRDQTASEIRDWLRLQLERPLRVAGVVPNTGEPGGGPFWVDGPEGGSLQIVEMAQIDSERPDQKACVEAATHFNPVDIVARLGGPASARPLSTWVDSDAAFVTTKSHQGRPIRVLEHPGLWNGAMSRWNTVFVEVPGTTFAPVKTVFDLLRPEHRGDG